MTRPYVILSVAMSLDGYIDDATPRRLILSNADDLDRADELRATTDAVLVGAGTIRADNPRLLVRSARRRAERLERGIAETPWKVTLTGGGDLDPGSRFFSTGTRQKLVYVASPYVHKAEENLTGVAIVIDAGDPVRLDAILADLATRGVGRLLVEGGGQVHTQFLAAGLVDELQVVTAPFFVGDPDAVRFVGPGLFPQCPDRPLRLAETRAIGDLVYARYLSERATDA